MPCWHWHIFCGIPSLHPFVAFEVVAFQTCCVESRQKRDSWERELLRSPLLLHLKLFNCCWKIVSCCCWTAFKTYYCCCSHVVSNLRSGFPCSSLRICWRHVVGSAKISCLRMTSTQFGAVRCVQFGVWSGNLPNKVRTYRHVSERTDKKQCFFCSKAMPKYWQRW